MASEVGGLLVNLGLDVAQIKRDVGKAQAELTDFRTKVDRQIGKAQKSFRRLTSGVQGLVAVLGAQQLGAAVGQSLSQLEEINRQADALGANVETIQELQFAFRQFGLQQKDVTDALATISDRADDALSGMQSFVEDFERFGVSVDDLRGKSPGELFRTVSESISNLDSEQRQVTAAVRLFGDEVGQRLLPLIRQGADGLDQYAKRAQEVGAVQDKELVQSSAKAAKEFRELREVVSARFTEAVAQNADELRDLANALTTAATSTAKFGSAVVNFVQKTAEDAAAAVEGIAAGDLPRLREELAKEREELNKLQRQQVTGQGDQRGIEQRIKGQQEVVNKLKERVEQAEKINQRAQRDEQQQEQVTQEVEKQAEAAKKRNEEQKRSLEGSIGSDFGAELPTVLEVTRNVDQLRNEWQQADKAAESYTITAEQIKSQAKELRQAGEQFGMTLGDSLEEAVFSSQKLSESFDNLGEQLARLIFRQTVLKQITSATGQISASLFSGDFGGGSAGVAASVPTGARAEGGPVSKGGTFLVGERGPELFTPKQDGNITSNEDLGRRPVVENNVTIKDGPGEPKVTQTEREGPDGKTVIETIVDKQVADSINKGRLDKPMKNRFGVTTRQRRR